MDNSASRASPTSGNTLTAPAIWLFSTSPAATCSTTSTPAFLPIFSTHLHFRKLVQSIERGCLVALRESRIVKNRVHEVFDSALQRKNRLANVQQLGSAFADNVHAEDFFSFRLKNQFQPARGVPANLSAGNFAKVSDAHFIGDACVGQLLFRFADERNFRDGVNAVGIVRGIGVNRHAKSICGSDAALLHRNRTEAWESDDVADGKNVRLPGAILGIHRNASTRICFQSRNRDIQFIDVSLAANSVKQSFSGHLLLALKVGDHSVVGSFFYPPHFSIHPHPPPPAPP